MKGSNYENFDIAKEIAGIHGHLRFRTHSLSCLLSGKGKG
jgi:hypothetical protein